MPTRTFRDAGRAGIWLALASSVVWAAACSSSSGGAKSEPDSGTNVISPLSDAAAGGLNLMCGQLAGIGGGTATPCAVGQTCCTTFTLALPPSASSVCTAKDACTGVSNECMTSADCATGQVCCTGSPPSDASADAAASGPSFGGFSLGSFATTCQASCASGQTQQCSSDMECPTGEICQSLVAGFTGDGGIGDAGFDASIFGDAGFDASFFGDAGIVLPKYCVAPPTDAGSTPDSSEPVIDSAAPVVDAGADAALPTQ
jgi:hypothetical protein